MKKKFASVGAALVVLFLVLPQLAVAEEFDLQQFHPIPNTAGNFFDAASADVASHMSWSGMLLFNYGNNPLVRRDDEGESLESLVRHHGTAHLLLSLGIADRAELGLDIPVVVLQSGTGMVGTATSPGDAGAGIGDLRLVPKVQLFSNRESEGDSGIAFALLVDTYLPTGNGEMLQGGDFRIGPRVAFDADFGGPKLGVNVGYLYRSAEVLENLEVRDTVGWNLAFELPVVDDLVATTEIFGRLTPGAAEMSREQSPTEALVGMKYYRDGLQLVGGAGAGLVSGYGTPRARLFAGVGWSPPVAAVEELEPEPQCRPETVEADCTDVPPPSCVDGAVESHVATCEEGQCSYAATQTPCDSGTRCEEVDGTATCVAIPECDGDDQCTDVPEPTCEEDVLTTYAGQCVEGSCHYEGTQTRCEEDYECGLRAGTPACVERTDLVEVDEERERIEIGEVVYFEVNSHEIAARSHRLLDQVATVLRDNPQLVRVRIEGHTDSTGSRDYNLDLSQRRAESVRAYLIGQDVAGERLDARGFGPDRPVEDNATEEGRAANRRVEFHIVEIE